MEPTFTDQELTPKQALFVEHYAHCLNGAKAARLAGYSPDTAAVIACENLTKPNVRAAVTAALSGRLMSAGEAAKRLSDIAATRLNDYLRVHRTQGRAQVLRPLSELVAEKEGEIDFVREFFNREGLHSEEQQKPFQEQLVKLRQELLTLLLEQEAHGAEAQKLVPGPLAIVEHTDLDLVALARADEQGLLHKFKHTKDGVQVELADPVPALRDILKLHGRLVDRTDITSGGQPLTARVEVVSAGPAVATSEKDGQVTPVVTATTPPIATDHV